MTPREEKIEPVLNPVKIQITTATYMRHIERQGFFSPDFPAKREMGKFKGHLSLEMACNFR